MSRSLPISAREARLVALHAQGLSTRSRRIAQRSSVAALEDVMAKVKTIQLDAVNVLARTQHLVAFSRIGAHDASALYAASGPGGSFFEYWGHAASLLPVELHPLFRWKMEAWRSDLVDSPAAQQRRSAWRREHHAYLGSVLAEVTDRGPLSAGQLSEPRRRSGTWWGRRSDGRRALELLFGEGTLAAWRNHRFERIYDLSERVIPSEVLARETPKDDQARRALVELAAEALGVATMGDLADYFWIRPGPARQAVAELVEEGRLVGVTVENWREPAYMASDLREPPGPLRRARLLSPFDSLIWTRARAERLFGFRYRIEIYVPATRRLHGYYVLPVLLGDDLVARLDLKADRKRSSLRVVAAHAEFGRATARLAQAVGLELRALGSWLALERVEVQGPGDLSSLLADAVAASSIRGASVPRG